MGVLIDAKDLRLQYKGKGIFSPFERFLESLEEGDRILASFFSPKSGANHKLWTIRSVEGDSVEFARIENTHCGECYGRTELRREGLGNPFHLYCEVCDNTVEI